MKRILVVDDQMTVRRLVEMALAGTDIEVLQAESGEQALAMVRELCPDLIIMDIMMPGGMDGIEAVRILRSQPEICDCPILILTAKDQKPERQKAFDVGGDDYLAKPFKLNDLIEKVQNLLHKATADG